MFEAEDKRTMPPKRVTRSNSAPAPITTAAVSAARPSLIVRLRVPAVPPRLIVRLRVPSIKQSTIKLASTKQSSIARPTPARSTIRLPASKQPVVKRPVGRPRQANTAVTKAANPAGVAKAPGTKPWTQAKVNARASRPAPRRQPVQSRTSTRIRDRIAPAFELSASRNLDSMSATTLGQDADLSLRRMYQQLQVHARTLGIRETTENRTILRPIRQLLEVAIGSIEDQYEPSAPQGPIVRIGGEDDGRPLPASPPTPDLGDRIGARPGQTTIVGDTPSLSPPALDSGRLNNTSTARNQRAGNGISSAGDQGRGNRPAIG